MRVKTRLRSTPPASRTKAAARLMCAAAAGSPARRSAAQASTVVERSPGPPKYVAHEPSGRCFERIQTCGSLGGLRLEQAEEVAEEQVLRVDRHVGLELALPVAGGLLQGEQMLGCAAESGLAGVDRAVGSDGHATPSRAAPAAARPLRTALSIVAGHPVSVQAPAR